MKATRLKPGPDTLIRLSLGKGVLLIFTPTEFATALQRGKMERRAQRRATYAQQQQARRDADALAWIEKEG